MLVITLIGVILGLGRYELAAGITAFIFFAPAFILSSKAVYRREKEGFSFSEDEKAWIFLCSFAYVSTMIALPGTIIVLIVSIVREYEDPGEFDIRILLPMQIAMGVAWWFAFLYMRRIWRRAIGKETYGKRTDSPEVNQ